MNNKVPLIGIPFGLACFASATFAVPTAQAQAPCTSVPTNNTSACVVAPNDTVGGITTSGDGSAIEIEGTVTFGAFTTGTNSSVANSGSVSQDIRTFSNSSSVTNSGSVGQDIRTDGNESSVTNFDSVTRDIVTNGNNSTVTNDGHVGRTIATDGDNSSVTNSSSAGQDILTSGANSSVENSGTVGRRISTNGGFSGVTNSGSVSQNIATNQQNSAVTNSGSVGSHIVTFDGSSHVTNTGTVGTYIETQGDDSGVTNSGSVGADIQTHSDNSSVTNSGSVGADIQTHSDNSSVTNSGSVGADIQTHSDNSSVTNSGSVGADIQTQGDNAGVTNLSSVGASIRTQGDGANVMNSGTVGTFLQTNGDNSSVTNSNSVATFIRTTGDNANVTNSGSVGSGDAGDGIFITGLNPSLTLLRGSVIQGQLDLAGAGTRTLNVAPGLAFAYTFVNGPTVINAPGTVAAINGNQAAAVETTAMSQTGQLVTSVTLGISSTVHSRLGGAPDASSNATAGPQFGGGYLMGLGATVRDEPKRQPIPSERRSGAWALAFGGRGSDDATATSAATAHAFAGAVAGVDGWLSPHLRAGFFGGGADSNLEVASDIQKVETETVFAGAYANLTNGTSFVRLVVTAGRSEYESRRRVANNLTGVQEAAATFDGSFISPEVAIGTAFDLGWVGIEPSARIGYTHLSLDEYSETGVPGNFTVLKQAISVWQGRVQVAMPFRGNGAVFAPRIGVEAWSSDRGTISGRLLGQAISFEPGGDDSEVTVFAGASASTSLGVGATAFLDGEVHAGDNGIARSEAHAGLRFNF